MRGKAGLVVFWHDNVIFASKQYLAMAKLANASSAFLKILFSMKKIHIAFYCIVILFAAGCKVSANIGRVIDILARID